MTSNSGQLDAVRLAARARARKDARAAVDLIVQGAAGLGDEERLAFWDEVRAELDERCPESQSRATPLAGPAAMGDEEAARFEARDMPWGKHRGTRIADVPAGYLDYVANTKDQFKEDLARYVARPEVQQELSEPE